MKSDRSMYLGIFSRNLKALRKAKGFTQERLAYEAELSYKHFQDVENGKKCPSLTVFIDICRALDVSFDEILRGLSGSKKIQEGS